MVGHDLTGQTVLDAFAGSGLLGLEAWSRGAEVTLVERDRRALQGLRANAQLLGASVQILGGDVLALAPTLGRFHGVLVDPPYALAPGPILLALAPLVGRWLMLESDASVEAPAPPPGLELDRRRIYGSTALTLYVRAEEPDRAPEEPAH